MSALRWPWRMSGVNGLCKMCTVYLAREERSALIATMYLDDFYFEVDGEISACPTDPIDRLGRMVKQHFLASARQPSHRDWRLHKKKDWPAFKVSGCKTAAQFERDYVSYTVRGANEANAVAILESREMDCGLALTTSCNPFVEDALGRKLDVLHRRFISWERA